ncbi:MAG: thiamine phosphate synthase [Rikenellaceae bacterium]
MNFGLYVIATQPTLPYGEVAEICVRKGIKYLQLREKNLSDKELLRAAAEILEVTKGTATKMVVNDRADIAKIAGADLLHLGQDDLSVEDARKIVGDMPIGLSTHSIEQAREALKHNPEYIGFGPIYKTTTKENPDPTVGTQLLEEVLKFVDTPVVAIGGIFMENIQEVLRAGATNLSMVRYLMCDDMEARIEEVQNAMARAIKF